MRRRHAVPTASLLLLLTLGLAGPALGKGGTQARLDAPIPADSPAGTTIEVGWTTFQTDGQGGSIVAFSGAPVFIALRAPGAEAPGTLVFGDEYPSGSGHFTASIVVPDGGIAPGGVVIGLRGTVCEAGTTCVHHDLAFELVGAVLVSAPVASAIVAAPVRDPIADPAATARVTPTASAVDSTPVVAIGPVSALALVGLLGVAIRRREVRRLATH